MEQSIELMLSIYLLVIGMSCLFNAKYWVKWVKHIKEQDTIAALNYGILILLFGSFIISFHWIWDGWGIITTFIGIFVLLKGAAYLFTPTLLAKQLGIFMRGLKSTLRFAGFISILLGLVVLYGWWETYYKIEGNWLETYYMSDTEEE
jgi:uncharacterized protein YjeT (DUF2065 family)